MLPAVIRKNSEDLDIEDDYLSLLNSVSFDEDCQASTLDELVTNHLKLAGLPLSISDFGVKDEHVGELAEDAMGQWTSSFNPIDLSYRDFSQLYGAVL